MKKFFSIFSLTLCLCNTRSGAQTPFTTTDSVDINNINASVMVHGDMWWNPATTNSHCSFPNGSGKNISSAGALWMSGYDAVSHLHIAAQTYRQAGNDYWPGPLDNSASLTYATSQNWAKIWKVTRKDIQIFQALSTTGTATPSNTAAAIWEWPANGNTGAKGNGGASLSITSDMAPFVDINGDGIYEPQLGEYPDVPGDEALWWVFSDNGPTHSQTNGSPLGVEIHAMAFAFKRWDLMDNVVYYQYTILNKSTNNYQNFRVGQFADMDLGQKNNDYIGCDTTRGMGIIYNGSPTDAVYGSSLPIAGLMLRVNSGWGFSSFMYINNDASGMGNPTSPAEYDNYLRSTFRDGTHATDDYTAPGTMTTAHGAGPAANYVFDGNPANNADWSECSSGNTPGDRRFVISSGDASLNAGASMGVTFILLTSNPGPDNACGDPGFNFTHIDSVADGAVTVYDEHYHLPVVPISVATVPVPTSVHIYPNPANNVLFIDDKDNTAGEATITVRNVLGQVINIPVAKKGQQYIADISGISPGLYSILYNKAILMQP